MSVKTRVSALPLGKEGAVGVWPKVLRDMGRGTGSTGEREMALSSGTESEEQ